jgi:hypothetical protein
LGVQYYVVYRRALPLWGQLGPDAGRPLRVQFTQFTQSPGAFFATFGGGGPGGGGSGGGGPAGSGWGQSPGQGQGPSGSGYDDPNVIDVEVVEDEDDHGPPELRAPH